ncbi:MAG: EAL domain-containing protein [Betaproteobacteria bacterium]
MSSSGRGTAPRYPAAKAGDIGTWVGDLRGDQIWWSDECYALFGFDQGGPKRNLRSFFQRVHPEDRRRVREMITNGLSGPGSYEVEYRVILPDGNIQQFVNHGFTLCDDNGLPVSAGGTTRPAGIKALTELSRRQADCLRVLLGCAEDGMGIFDGELGLRHWNAHFIALLGLSAEFVHAGTHPEILLLPLAVRGDFGAGDPVAIVDELLARLAEGENVRFRPGRATLELRGVRLDDGGTLLICTDVSRKEEARERLLVADAIAASNLTGVIVADGEHRIRSANTAFTGMTGFGQAEMLGREVYSLIDEQSLREVAAALKSLDHRASWTGEAALRKQNGDALNAKVTITCVADPEGKLVDQYLWLFADMSESKRAAEQVYNLAHHDALTGLPNRLALYMRLNQALPEARRRSWSVALMFLDLDRFKIINDTLGHSIGDEMLREVAARLSRSVRESDMVARIGGDEFVILLPDIASAAVAATVAGKVLTAFANPITVDGVELHTSPSIGISIFPDDGLDGDTILKNADTAMYCAKAAGRNNYQFYAAEMNLAATERLDLERKLRQALLREEFALAFQPQLMAGDQRPVGVEALVRWHHPTDGVIPPIKFIPIAEETGLIVALGEWVLRTACHEMKRWLDAGLPPIKVAVNVSARQLRRRDFLETVAGALVESDLPPHLLELEVTESVAMDNPEESIRLLQAIRQMGVSIAIDDFGTGYSSLAYLKRLPIDYLKIDRSFVADIEHDLNDRAIAFGTIALAHSLGLEVIAEGVETEDQLELLRTNGCDEIQGYFFSPPLQPAAAFAYMSKRFEEYQE